MLNAISRLRPGSPSSSGQSSPEPPPARHKQLIRRVLQTGPLRNSKKSAGSQKHGGSHRDIVSSLASEQAPTRGRAFPSELSRHGWPRPQYRRGFGSRGVRPNFERPTTPFSYQQPRPAVEAPPFTAIRRGRSARCPRRGGHPLMTLAMSALMPFSRSFATDGSVGRGEKRETGTRFLRGSVIRD